jgi:hypothetical protein
MFARGLIWLNWKAGGDRQSPVPGVKMASVGSVSVEIAPYVAQLDEPVYL